MPDSLLHKVARAGWNDTDPLSLAKARAVLRVVREELEAARPYHGSWADIHHDATRRLLARFPEEAG